MIKNRTLLIAVLTIVHFHRTACGNEIIMKLSNPSKRSFLVIKINLASQLSHLKLILLSQYWCAKVALNEG